MNASLAEWLRHPPQERERPGFDSRFRRGDVSGSSHTSDLNIDTPVASLPDAWRHRVSAGTGLAGVSKL